VKLDLFYITFDGVDSFYCGVGALTQYFLFDAPVLQCSLRDTGTQVKIHILYTRVPPEASFFSPDIAQRSRNLALAAGITLHELDPIVATDNPFGTIESWPYVCERAISLINDLAEPESFVLALPNDTPFAGMLPMFSAVRAPRKSVVWLVQSTAKLWSDPVLLPLDEERVRWEQTGMDAATQTPQISLGATSRYIKEHLATDWGVEDDVIVPYHAGIAPGYLHRYYPESGLESLGIRDAVRHSNGRPLLLSFGRAAWYKGLDTACAVAREVAERSDLYPIVCAADYGTPDSSRAIAALRREFHLPIERGCLLTDFDFDLPKYLMQHGDLRVVLVPSKRENLSAIPSEARILSRGNAVVVASAVGGLSEQFDSGVDGFLFNPDDPQSAVDVCLDLATANQRRLSAIATSGRERVIRDYRLGNNLTQSVRATLCSSDDVPHMTRKRLSATTP
jgi:glycosyltransferase involved in cell wall biosynthesis